MALCLIVDVLDTAGKLCEPGNAVGAIRWSPEERKYYLFDSDNTRIGSTYDTREAAFEAIKSLLVEAAKRKSQEPQSND